MNTFAKILVTAVVLFLFFLLFGAVVGMSGGKSPGILGLVFFAGLIGALHAIWKKPKKEKDDNNDESMLQK